jgi:hypothetical protein
MLSLHLEHWELKFGFVTVNKNKIQLNLNKIIYSAGTISCQGVM